MGLLSQVSSKRHLAPLALCKIHLEADEFAVSDNSLKATECLRLKTERAALTHLGTLGFVLVTLWKGSDQRTYSDSC